MGYKYKKDTDAAQEKALLASDNTIYTMCFVNLDDPERNWT